MSRQYKNGTCSCWRKVNRELQSVNTVLDYTFDFSGMTYLRVATWRTDGSKAKPPKTVIASFCPFCGNKLKRDN